MAQVTCPHCDAKQETEAKTGELVRCEVCHKVFEIPSLVAKSKPHRASITPVEYYEDEPEKKQLRFDELPKYVKYPILVLLVMIGVALVAIVPANCSGFKSSQSQERKVELLFSGWDGSNSEMVRAAKSVMKDPKSFEHIETRYSDRGDKVFVQMRFRGKNSFNATVTQTAYGFIDPNTRQLSGFSIE